MSEDVNIRPMGSTPAWADRELPKYRCHKEVWALKIKDVVPTSNPTTGERAYTIHFAEEGYAPVNATPGWVGKHLIGYIEGTGDLGYYVVYKDGYVSWSPSPQFEEGYTKAASESETKAFIDELRARPILSPPPAPTPPPVDRSAQVLTDGSPVPEDRSHVEKKDNGQQKAYVVLTEAERAKGFVRPVRTSYVHQTCGVLTTMGQSIAETYARDPHFYSGTFCVGCGSHFPVGEDGEFVWDGTDIKVGT